MFSLKIRIKEFFNKIWTIEDTQGPSVLLNFTKLLSEAVLSWGKCIARKHIKVSSMIKTCSEKGQVKTNIMTQE